jgi:cation diffusion facilitator CzcD-associated flavoprotein CzcO
MSRHEYLIIGAGPGGICAGIKLKESGREDFVILEKASGVGGTWYHNRYPGAACDVPSHLYSFSFDTRADWPRPFSEQPAILDYMEQCVEKHGLSAHLRLNSAVSSAQWDDSEALWHVTTKSGEAYEARILLCAIGMFNDLNYGNVPGIDRFAGTTFHSARWNEEHELAGRRVAVIGSAASAVQLVPVVAKIVEQLDLYQRTANWVLPKDDEPFTPEQLDNFRDDPAALGEARQQVFKMLEPILTFDNEKLMAGAARVGRAALDAVEDPGLRRRLAPTHPYGCKRPLLSNDYYPTFNRANVELVTDPIERVEPEGVVTADGRLRKADTIILATGFHTTRFLSAIDVTGRDGRSLAEAWSEGAYAYLGTMIPSFPNLFMMYGPNTNNGSILHMIESQVAFAVQQIERIESEELAWLEVREDVTQAYNADLQQDLDGVDVWHADCSGYYRSPSGRIVTQWPHNMTEYRSRTREPDRAAFVSEPRAST